MRLYLSSHLLGNDPNSLVRLAGKGARCALILNALDNAAEAREHFRESQTLALEALGFTVEELDLRRHFGNAGGLSATLKRYALLWITGGNAFILRKAFRQSGLDGILPDLLARDEIVYAGFSAAAVITFDTLRGLTPSPASTEPQYGYGQELIWEGLGITPYAIVVHHESNHPGRAAASEERAFYVSNAIPHRLLRDGEALVVHGCTTYTAGERK